MEEKLEFVLKSKIALSKINCERKTEFQYLKPLQAKSVKAALCADTLCILPTDYGKSMIFEILPRFSDSKAIIISPLNAIIEEQSVKLARRSLRIDAKLVTDIRESRGYTDTVKRFLKGEAMYVIGHPEHVLTKEICTALRQEHWKSVKHIIIDEAHCIVQWGHDFRPEYRSLAKLRAIFPDALVVALTATATKDTQKEITKSLCMKNVTVVSSSADRRNVKITVKRRLPITGGNTTTQESFENVLAPYIRQLCEDPDGLPKTIVYSKLKWCGAGYEMAYRAAIKHGSVENIMKAVSQYHAPCTDEVKKTVVRDMAANGRIRLLFATEAYGMGADSPDVRRIIHVGPPTSLETYMQEMGRAGRDGNSSEAVLYFNMNDIGGNTNVKPEVREFCLLETCRRKYICEHFGTLDFQPILIPHCCCDICARTCDCDTCIEKVMATCALNSPPECDTLCTEQASLEICRTMLTSYFNAENSIIETPNPEIMTCLTKTLVEKIVTEYEHLNNENDVKMLFSYLQPHFLQNIWGILDVLKNKQL